MAAANPSTPLRARAHPLAKSGYGKRHAPGEAPRGAADFVHLPAREAAIAAYLDRLPTGAAIGYKPLAATLADHGQTACRSSLRMLTDAGHLRRIKVHLVLDLGGFRWVTRTYFSRTARDAGWWAVFVREIKGVDVTYGEGAREEPGSGGVADAAGEDAPGSVPGSETGPETGSAAGSSDSAEPSRPYRLLAALGRTEPRMTLSHADCAALEDLAAAWLARGATPEHVTRALTADLPHPLHSPGALARNRLEKKMPPKPARAREIVSEAVMVCFDCEEPETTTPLVNGLCLQCRAELDTYAAIEARGGALDVPDTFRTEPIENEIGRRVNALRAAAGLPVPERGTVPGPRTR